VISIDDLDQAVEDLRKLGFDAFHEFVYSPHGCLEGLDVGEDFFPLWELQLPDNRADVAAARFDAIKARRSPDWTPQRPLPRAAAV
jgi:hypothetical protein